MAMDSLGGRGVVARRQDEMVVALGAIEAPGGCEASAHLEILLGSAAGTGAPNLQEPSVLAGPHDGDPNTCQDKRGNEDEVRHRDEHADQRHAPAEPEPGGRPRKPPARILVQHCRDRRGWRRAKSAERRWNVDGVHGCRARSLSIYTCGAAAPAPRRSSDRNRPRQIRLAAVTTAAKKTGATGLPDRSRTRPARSRIATMER